MYNDAYGSIPGVAFIWKQNMGGDGRDDGVDREISSLDLKTHLWKGSEEGRHRGMGVVLSGHGTGYHRDLDDKGVREEATGNNRVVCIRETSIQNFTGAELMEGSSRFIRRWDQ